MTFGLRSFYAEVSHGFEAMKGLRLALCVLPFLSGGVVLADSIASSMIQLQVGQPIRSVDASLLASGGCRILINPSRGSSRIPLHQHFRPSLLVLVRELAFVAMTMPVIDSGFRW